MISRENRYSKVSLDKALDTLPVGIPVITNGDYTGEIIRDITFRKLSHSDLKLIWDRNFTRSHPMKWIARVLSLVVDNIGGEPVYSAFKAHNFKPSKVPDIILSLSNADANYVMYAGHVFNFGTELKEINCKCDTCRRDNIVDVNLADLEVEFDIDTDGSHRDNTRFTVELVDGFRFSNDEGTESEVYKFIDMECPTVGDAVRNEAHFQLNDQGTFTERMYHASMKDIYTGNGVHMDTSRLRNVGPQIFGFISGLDSSKIESAVNDVPSLIVLTDDMCKYCSSDLTVFINSNFLYPRRS